MTRSSSRARLRLAAVATCIMAAPLPAFAHHPDVSAGGGSGPIATISASTPEAGHGAVAFIDQFIKVRGFDFNSLGTNQHAHTMEYINSPSLAAAYGVTDDFMLSVRLPYVKRASVTDGHKHANPLVNAHVTNLGDSSGVGDLTVLGQYRFYNNQASGTELAVLFGLKAPTGRTDRITSEGDRFEAEFQPGSGSWDGLLGGGVSQRLGNGLSFHASGLYILATKGTQETDLGDRFIYGVAAVYRLTGSAAAPAAPHHHAPGTPPHSHAPKSEGFSLDGVLELNGEWQARQTIAGLSDPNSGGHTVYLSPGLRASYGRYGGFLSVGIPIVNDLNGNQGAPDYRVLTGVSVAFGD